MGTACGGAGTDSGAQGTAPTELRLAIGGEPEDGYDPTLGWGRYGSPLFQSTLLDRDEHLDVVPDLATSWSTSADGLVWTVDIRTDARFTDGEPVTAADVAYTFTTAAESGGLTDVTALAEAVAVDEDTVELRLERPRSTFVNRLVSLGVVPEHAYGADYARDPVGSGPFRLVQWDVIDQRLHADAVLFGWGSHDPAEMYNLYSSTRAGVEYWNPGFYASPRVDAHLEAAMTATDEATAVEHWRAAQHDGEGTGFGPRGDAAWAWLVNLDHTYLVDECLDLGTPQIEPHGHGWPVTAGITGWQWSC
ncbi:ABC transporter substrate-binding protein [Modestobacter sp. I12A-02662]|uniref:ABC transporter substrate-binding protein n=1 Tax=Modestobacter sp. I12A-02662 TaxID=1730496 RepID=UPI0034E02E19